jgi:hypothetical protein
LATQGRVAPPPATPPRPASGVRAAAAAHGRAEVGSACVIFSFLLPPRSSSRLMTSPFLVAAVGWGRIRPPPRRIRVPHGQICRRMQVLRRCRLGCEAPSPPVCMGARFGCRRRRPCAPARSLFGGGGPWPRCRPRVAMTAAGGLDRVAVVVSGGRGAWPCRRRGRVRGAAPLLALSVVGSGLERGDGESLGSACGLMMTTPSGAVYLLEGVILLPLSSLSSLPSG